MQLSNDELSQLDEEELLNLSEDDLRRISVKLLTDLKEARERLNQNSHNSSRPPSSEAPWEKETPQDACNNDSEETHHSDNQTRPPTEKPDKAAKQSSKNETEESRKPGKQLGAKGFGRTQKLAITHYQDHVPETCGCCHQPLNATNKKATTAFETIDLEWADEKTPGLRLTNTKHSYYEIRCHCGHITQKELHRSNSQDTLQDITCSQWRLVGSGLASLIICLTYRMRLSRECVQEFLNDWLGLKLSIGTINNTLHESGAAALPIEQELVKEIVASQQLHVDETSWMELTTFLWLWVFSTESVTAYWIATRSSELIENILGQAYGGWLMSDGYQVYRKYLNRVRCWAHLIRKAQGLQEGLDKDSELFGEKTLNLMAILMTAIREARTHPPNVPLTEMYQTQMMGYRQLCEKMKESTHKKTKALATEMLNDWEAIFRVLEYPHLPLTNNEAERALRHWVILRRISYGTRTEEGSCVFAICAVLLKLAEKDNNHPGSF